MSLFDFDQAAVDRAGELYTKRMRILTVARQFVTDGAHYLWGAEGLKPSPDGKVLLAPVELDPSKPNFSFCAATMNGNVCVGRFRHPDLANKTPQQRVWNGSSSDLADFIDQNSGNAQEGWGSALTPRRINGYTGNDARGVPSDYGGAGDLLGKVVWGEGCDDTRHFDCGGFVRYVVSEVCGVPIAGISGTTASGSPKNRHHKPMGILVSQGDQLQPADIFFYGSEGNFHHVAFASEGQGSYMRGQSYYVVQAESAVFGLNSNKEPRRSGDFKCVRISASTLLNRPIDD